MLAQSSSSIPVPLKIGTQRQWSFFEWSAVWERKLCLVFRRLSLLPSSGLGMMTDMIAYYCITHHIDAVFHTLSFGIQNVVFCSELPCIWVDGYRRFGRTCCLPLERRSETSLTAVKTSHRTEFDYSVFLIQDARTGVLNVDFHLFWRVFNNFDFK